MRLHVGHMMEVGLVTTNPYISVTRPIHTYRYTYMDLLLQAPPLCARNQLYRLLKVYTMKAVYAACIVASYSYMD